MDTNNNCYELIMFMVHGSAHCGIESYRYAERPSSMHKTGDLIGHSSHDNSAVVARSESMTEAAHKLGVSPTVLSHPSRS